LSDVAQSDPAFLQTQLLLADLYQMEGLDEVAEQKLIKANQHAPDEPIISFGLGDFYLSKGDYQKSIPYFKMVLHHDRSDQFKGEIELKIAEAFSGSGEFEEALIYYEKGLKEKTEIQAIFGYGYTAYQLEQYELAIEQLNKLQQLDPHYTSLYPYLAKCYEALNDLEKSLAVLKEGMSYDEYNEHPYIQAGKLCFKMQDPESGEHFLQQVLKNNPSQFDAAQTLAAFYKHEERFDDLITMIENYKEFGEDDPLLTWYMAYAYQKEEEHEKARLCFEEAYNPFEDNPDFLEEYSLFLIENGNKKLAIRLLNKTIELDDTKEQIKDLLLQIEDERF
jgi:tetratricopeptide (TPR) repeat protein